jgi:hypothetical protein
MRKWEDLPKEVLATMEWLGRFGPTTDPSLQELKGLMLDKDGDSVKVYIDAKQLRSIADDFYQVADWLEDRAVSESL